MPTFRHLFTGLYLLSLCSLWACQSETATAYQNTVHLTQQDFQHRVQSEGELVPLEKTTLQVPRRLWGTLEYLAPEGTQVKKGDVVLYGKWSGTEVKIDGKDVLIMRESDIMGVLD